MIALENGEIYIYKLDKMKKCLCELLALPSCGQEPIDSISDSFWHPENQLINTKKEKIVAKFGLTFKGGYLCFIQCNQEMDEHFEFSVVMVKFDVTENKLFASFLDSKRVKLQDFYRNKLLFQLENSCLLYNLGNYTVKFSKFFHNIFLT
jgi:hypothetical protein